MPVYPQQYRLPARRVVAQAPLKSILGRPGKFFDQRSKKVYDISQAYEGEKYDSILVVNGAQAAGTQYTWFNNLQNKNRIDTNFRTQNRLDPNERLVLERIGLYLHTAHGQVLGLINDIRRCLENGYLSLEINQDILWDGVATWLPSGYGIYGQSVENNATFASVGVPGTAAAARLRRKQMITADHALSASMTFQGRPWITATAGAVAYVNPTLTNDMVLKLVLHGPISRPATR